MNMKTNIKKPRKKELKNKFFRIQSAQELLDEVIEEENEKKNAPVNWKDLHAKVAEDYQKEYKE